MAETRSKWGRRHVPRQSALCRWLTYLSLGRSPVLEYLKFCSLIADHFNAHRVEDGKGGSYGPYDKAHACTMASRSSMLRQKVPSVPCCSCHVRQRSVGSNMVCVPTRDRKARLLHELERVSADYPVQASVRHGSRRLNRGRLIRDRG